MIGEFENKNRNTNCFVKLSWSYCAIPLPVARFEGRDTPCQMHHCLDEPESENCQASIAEYCAFTSGRDEAVCDLFILRFERATQEDVSVAFHADLDTSVAMEEVRFVDHRCDCKTAKKECAFGAGMHVSGWAGNCPVSDCVGPGFFADRLHIWAELQAGNSLWIFEVEGIRFMVTSQALCLLIWRLTPSTVMVARFFVSNRRQLRSFRGSFQNCSFVCFESRFSDTATTSVCSFMQSSWKIKSPGRRSKRNQFSISKSPFKYRPSWYISKSLWFIPVTVSWNETNV